MMSKIIFQLKVKNLLILTIVISLLITFSITSIYFNSLSGADNYKYMDNILYIFGESSDPYDNQGLLYFFIVSLIFKIRTKTFNYENEQSFISDNTQSLFLSETIQLANLYFFIFGLIGFYYLMKKMKIGENKALFILILFCYFPTFYYLRLNMKPEILAFALIPWLFYFYQSFLLSKANMNLIAMGVITAVLLVSKSSIAAMVIICVFLMYIHKYNVFSLKHLGVGALAVFISFGSLLVENYFLDIGNILEREPEINYDNKAPIDFVYSVDFERLRKDPKKNYHSDSLVSITLIDLFSDYFELNWEEDSSLFNKNIKPLIVERERNLNNDNLKFINLDINNKHLIYSGPHPNYLKYQTRYAGLMFSVLFFYLIIYTFIRENKINRIYLTFPLLGLFVLLINSIFGFPQNNFDPAVGDTFKVFYYSFLIPFPLIVIMKNLNLKKLINLISIGIFIIFTFINLGFPKINDEIFDSKITVAVENNIICELNKQFIQQTLVNNKKIICENASQNGPFSTSIKKVPYVSTSLFILINVFIISKIRKDEE